MDGLSLQVVYVRKVPNVCQHLMMCGIDDFQCDALPTTIIYIPFYMSSEIRSVKPSKKKAFLNFAFENLFRDLERHIVILVAIPLWVHPRALVLLERSLYDRRSLRVQGFYSIAVESFKKSQSRTLALLNSIGDCSFTSIHCMWSSLISAVVLRILLSREHHI